MNDKRYGLHVLTLLGLVLSALGLVITMPRTVRAGDPLNGEHNFLGDIDESGIYDKYLLKFQQYDLEFGDAPEGALAYPATGVLGLFPTCMYVGPASWVQHTNFGAWFGPAFDFELDGNAGNCPLFNPNTYDMDECFADGDAGLLFPAPYTIQGPIGLETVTPCPGQVGAPLGATCQTAVWGIDIDIDITNFMPNQTDGFVNVLVDWNGDGQWAGASQCVAPGDTPEHVLVDFLVPNGFSGPLSALGPPPFMIGPNPGYAWARFTISEQPVGPDWHGEGSFEDGESEDYMLEITRDVDFGDAPDPTYPTLLASNGARHVIDGQTFLGASVDPEPDGQPDATATGDDNDGNDDEDGVVFTSGLMRGVTATVDVTASTAGLLNAWLDLNGDGDWADGGEQIFTDQALVAGLNNLGFVVPLWATPGPTYARFRFSTLGGLGYAGLAPDGEVEDYQVTIASPPPIDVDLSKRLLEPPGGVAVVSDTIRFQVAVSNTGGTAWVSNPFTDTFDGCMSFVGAYQDGVPVMGVGPASPLTWDLVTVNGGPIVPGQMVLIDLYFHANAGGICWNRAAVIEIDGFGQQAGDSDSASVTINTPPSISGLPDVIIDHTTILPVQIDLWAFAWDAETPASGLTYSIDNSPPAGAGVTIVGNRWLTINPSASWCGWTNVRVRVTDPGGLWDTDTFRMAVTWSCQG